MLFTLLKSRIRKRRLAQFRTNATPVFLNLQQVGSMAFLFKLEGEADAEAVKEIHNVLKETNIPLKGVIVEVSKSFKDEVMRGNFIEDFCKENKLLFIGKNELNWLGIPLMNSEVDEFLGATYDLLISFNDNGNFSLEYLATRAQARYMVGMENKPNMPYNIVFEQSIGHKGEHASAEYMKQLLAYLQNIQGVTAEKNYKVG